MIPETRRAGRELDAEIQRVVFGSTIAGWTTCVHVEGEWSIHVDSGTDGWACHAERGPVYVEGFCDGRDHRPLLLDFSGEATGSDRSIVERINADAVADFERDAELFGGHSRHCLAVVPEYSTDIVAAWLVVEKMRERGYEPCVEAQSNGQLPGWQCWFGHMLYDAGYAESDSVPLAICQSALSALASLLVSGERDA